MRQPLKCFFAVLLSVLIGCSLDAQAPTQVAPQIKVETRMVLVDVVVTNRKGEQISGLNQEDFRIKENGKPQVISAFEEHKMDPSAPVELPVLPSGVYTNRQVVKTNDSVNVLLIDMLTRIRGFRKQSANRRSNSSRLCRPGRASPYSRSMTSDYVWSGVSLQISPAFLSLSTAPVLCRKLRGSIQRHSAMQLK